MTDAAVLFQFAHPEALWLLLSLPIILLAARWQRRRRPGVFFSNFKLIRELARTTPQWIRHLEVGLRLLACVGLIVALARPQTGVRHTDRQHHSVDIMLALDVSESMSADDMRPNRLEAAKAVLSAFIKRRAQDRIGLVAFSGQAYSLMPLTTDHDTLLETLAAVERHAPHAAGTAIGDALLVAVNRMLDVGQAGAGRLLVLATDGVSNQGVDALAAAGVAGQKTIRIYAIGMGGDRPVLRMTRDYDGTRVPLTDAYGRKQYFELPDEALLRRMTAATHGRFFRAGDNRSFEEAMEAIDHLEKRPLAVKHKLVYQEWFAWPLAAALLMLFAEGLLARLRFRRLM